MGTLVAFFKPFDLSLQNLTKYKYLLYISLFVLFWFLLCSFTQGKKKQQKKGNERVGREKRKKDQMYQLRYF